MCATHKHPFASELLSLVNICCGSLPFVFRLCSLEHPSQKLNQTQPIHPVNSCWVLFVSSPSLVRSSISSIWRKTHPSTHLNEIVAVVVVVVAFLFYFFFYIRCSLQYGNGVHNAVMIGLNVISFSQFASTTNVFLSPTIIFTFRFIHILCGFEFRDVQTHTYTGTQTHIHIYGYI